GLAGLAPPEPHQALIDGDANQPGRKLRVALKLLQLFIRLQEGVLRNVLGVFAVLGDVLRHPENLPLILTYQLLEGRRVPFFRAVNQRNVRVYFNGLWRWMAG